MSLNTAVKQPIAMVKNQMNKFYNLCLVWPMVTPYKVTKILVTGTRALAPLSSKKTTPGDDDHHGAEISEEGFHLDHNQVADDQLRGGAKGRVSVRFCRHHCRIL